MFCAKGFTPKFVSSGFLLNAAKNRPYVIFEYDNHMFPYKDIFNTFYPCYLQND